MSTILKRKNKILELEKKLEEKEKEIAQLKEEIIAKKREIKHFEFLLKKAEAEIGIKSGYKSEGMVLTLIQLEEANKELKRLNEELDKTKANLDEKVKERTKELEIRTKELELSKQALFNLLDDVQKSRNALINILEDVEEEKRKTEEERDKTKAIINNLADALFLFDNQNKIALVNREAEKIFEIKGEDIIGKTINDLKEIALFAPIVDLIGSEIKNVFRKEVEIKKNLILEVTTLSVIRNEEKIGTLIILHDITREKLVEQMKSEFVSLAAHQLRTPLSAIKWTLKSLLDRDLGEITEEQRNFIEKTYISNERMISLINDLLNVTRIEEGRYLYKLTIANIEEITQNLLIQYKSELERKNIEFELIKPPEKLPMVFVDTEKINLAIQNLIENAICYTMPGGKITISLYSEQKNIVFTIADSGIGIPESQKERIFTKFFRAENAKRIDTEGSGLGLFIVKNIIEAHGGKIWFESKENQGTIFYFTLPIKEEFSQKEEFSGF